MMNTVVVERTMVVIIVDGAKEGTHPQHKMRSMMMKIPALDSILISVLKWYHQLMDLYILLLNTGTVTLEE